MALSHFKWALISWETRQKSFSELKRSREEARDEIQIEFLHFVSFIPKDYYYYYYSFKWNSTHEFLSHSVYFSLYHNLWYFIHLIVDSLSLVFFFSFLRERMCLYSFEEEEEEYMYIKIESLFIIRQSLRRISITRTFLPDVL